MLSESCRLVQGSSFVFGEFISRAVGLKLLQVGFSGSDRYIAEGVIAPNEAHAVRYARKQSGNAYFTSLHPLSDCWGFFFFMPLFFIS